MMSGDVRKKRILYVLVAFAMLLLLGIAYAWSIFVGPLENTYGWTRTQTSLAFTILMIAFSGGSIVTGILAGRIGFRKVCILAAVMVGTGFVGTAFTDRIQVLYVTYGILSGAGIGMMYNAIVSVIPRYFPDKQGMVTGVLLMGYALSTSILSPVCQALLRSRGPRFTFLLLGILNLVIFLGGSLICMKLPTAEDLSQLPQAASSKKSGDEEGLSTAQMLRTGRFYIYFLGAHCLVMIALCYLNHVVPALEGEFSMTASTAALVVSAMSLCNGIARPLAGQFIDRKGVKLTLRLISFIYLAATLLACLAFAMKQTVLLVAAACVLLFGYGCQGSSLPSVTRVLYGNKHFSMNYSVISLISLTASVGPSIMAAMQSASGGYFSGYLMLTVASIAAVPLMFLAGRGK